MDIKQLMKEWQLENILPHLLAEKIDAEILQMMKLHHIRQLLCNFPLGIQIRFEYNLEEWRHNIGKPLRTQNSCQENNYDIMCGGQSHSKNPTKTQNEKPNIIIESQDQTINVIPMDKLMQTSTLTNISRLSQETPDTANDITASATSFTNDLLRPMSNISTNNGLKLSLDAKDNPKRISYPPRPPPRQPQVNLPEILSQCRPDLSYFMKIYNLRKTFTKQERMRLVKCIVNYYLRNELRLDLQTSYALEEAVLNMFPKEHLELYRKTKRGSIYCRYMNAKKAFYAKYQREAYDSMPSEDNDDTFDMDVNASTGGDILSEGDGIGGLSNPEFEDVKTSVPQAEFSKGNAPLNEFSNYFVGDMKVDLTQPKLEKDSEFIYL